MLFRLVHYLPVAHLAVALFAAVCGLGVLGGALLEAPPRGVESLARAAFVCRTLAVLYLLITALLQYRLSQSGHGILAQPSRLWVAFVGEQMLLLVLLAGVLVRGPTSRLYLGGLHQAVAALLVAAGLSLFLAAVDRLAARRLARVIPGWRDEPQASRATALSLGFIVVSALLFFSISYLESLPLPHRSRPAPRARSGDSAPAASGLKRAANASRWPTIAAARRRDRARGRG